MGDLTVPHKRYGNIAKLLRYLGVSVDKLGKAEAGIWDKFTEPGPHEK